ncbi:hypothetical protein L6452_43461 [Arctium lappa]|uniref:Uncharacterized protein n=1 Tax=Arctium lappa TaxID=4217 RepID=A0ACB8XCK8_ARCLA|nr:hypothetical protein L6452_43461 [Arctium lappa]
MSYQLNMSAGYSLDFNNMTLSEVREKAKQLAGRLSTSSRMIDEYDKEEKMLKAENKDLQIQNSSLLIQINALKENLKDSDSLIDFAGIIESKEKEIFDLQAKLKRSESSSTCEISEELRKTNSQVFAERDKLKDQVLSLEGEINMLKEKATQDRDNSKAQDEMLKIEKERKEFAKKFSDFSRKAFEEKKSLELRCVKLSQQVSDFEKVIIIEREKAENEKKKDELKKANTDFLEEKKIFETEIAKLTGKLAEFSTNIMKEKNAKSELNTKFDLIEKERNSNFKKNKSQKKSLWRKDDEKDKGAEDA